MDASEVEWKWLEIRLCDAAIRPFIERLEYCLATKEACVIADVPAMGEMRVILKATRTAFNGTLVDGLWQGDIVRGADEAAIREFAAKLAAAEPLAEELQGHTLIFRSCRKGAMPAEAISPADALTPILHG